VKRVEAQREADRQFAAQRDESQFARLLQRDELRREAEEAERDRLQPVILGADQMIDVPGGFPMRMNRWGVDVRANTPLGDALMKRQLEQAFPGQQQMYGDGYYTGAGADYGRNLGLRATLGGPDGGGGRRPSGDVLYDPDGSGPLPEMPMSPGEVLAWKKSNETPPKPDPRTIAVPWQGKTIMMTPQEAAAVGYYYQPPEEAGGPSWIQRLLGIGGGQAAPAVKIDPMTGELIGG
jgi:hypothetical protein